MACAVAAATGLALPSMLAAATDAVMRHGGGSGALIPLAAVMAANALGQVTAGLAGARCVTAAQSWLRSGMVRHVLALGAQRGRRFAAGDLTSRLLGDAGHASCALPVTASLISGLSTAVGAVVALWLIDIRLGVAFVLGVPPAVLLLRRFLVGSTDLHGRYQRTFASIAVRLSDALTGVRTIRAAGTTNREVERVLVPLTDLAETGRATWRLQRKAIWKGMALMPLIEAMVLAVAGLAVVHGDMSPGQLLAAVGYIAFALSFFGQIDALMELAGVRASARRISEVLSLPTQPRPARPRSLSPGTGEVAFHSVTVTESDRRVLDRLDLYVPAGASLALVGRSGSGKSTLATLIGRLTDPDEGTVLLDGVDVTAMDPDELRRQIAYAFERPALIGDTIADAIAYARPTATRADVERAAGTARADTFIRRLPQGYDTPLSSAPLSGGEAQRLGLARAAAQNARVLVLDDATSSLDTVTEAQVTRALTGQFRGRTRVIVAHRAVTAARADLVAWLEDGRIRSVAPHERLWQHPEYRAVFDTADALTTTDPAMTTEPLTTVEDR
ncbi:ABC transporter ATP-binding protein [Streptomyces sp. NPDC086554]|uniref:ABC transporter ATP-binding protein n=1 Tax=Streptomyces sp. NPDC086554 TaxID=3154864 RepID=UPI00342B6551